MIQASGNAPRKIRTAYNVVTTESVFTLDPMKLDIELSARQKRMVLRLFIFCRKQKLRTVASAIQEACKAAIALIRVKESPSSDKPTRAPRVVNCENAARTPIIISQELCRDAWVALLFGFS